MRQQFIPRPSRQTHQTHYRDIRHSMIPKEHSVADETLKRLRAAQAEVREEYLAPHADPWIIGYSGGKDSTLLAQLVFEMLLDLAPGDRTRPVHILCNDTLVESPNGWRWVLGTAGHTPPAVARQETDAFLPVH